jgi:hypothetical protein
MNFSDLFIPRLLKSEVVMLAETIYDKDLERRKAQLAQASSSPQPNGKEVSASAHDTATFLPKA